MSKVKVHRQTPSLDMTPMVDLAFLLVTFFMLTTQFAPEDPVLVDTPSSTSEILIPAKDLITITISDKGRVLYNVDGKYTREKLITGIGQRYGIEFSPKEVHAFSILPSFGLPLASMSQYLSMNPEERKFVEQIGIPTDSTRNELADWIRYTRMANPKVRIAIKGDGESDYTAVKNVIKTLQDSNIPIFNLITNLEQAAGPAEVH